MTDQPADERGRLPKSQLRRRLDLLGRELQDVGDPVDQQAGHLDVVARVDSTIKTLGARCGFGSIGKSERDPQVVDRHHVAPQVDHPQQRLGPAGTSVSASTSSTS